MSPKLLINKPKIVITDTDCPNIVRISPAHEPSRILNRGLMQVSCLRERRTKVRIDFEVIGSWSGQWGYKRLRQMSILLSSPNAEQAELFIDAIHEFARQLSGKWLAPTPVPSGQSADAAVIKDAGKQPSDSK